MEKNKALLAEAEAALAEIASVSNKGPQHRAVVALMEVVKNLDAAAAEAAALPPATP